MGGVQSPWRLIWRLLGGAFRTRFPKTHLLAHDAGLEAVGDGAAHVVDKAGAALAGVPDDARPDAPLRGVPTHAPLSDPNPTL